MIYTHVQGCSDRTGKEDNDLGPPAVGRGEGGQRRSITWCIAMANLLFLRILFLKKSENKSIVY